MFIGAEEVYLVTYYLVTLCILMQLGIRSKLTIMRWEKSLFLSFIFSRFYSFFVNFLKFSFVISSFASILSLFFGFHIIVFSSPCTTGVRKSLLVGSSISAVSYFLLATARTKLQVYVTLFSILPLGNRWELTIELKLEQTSKCCRGNWIKMNEQNRIVQKNRTEQKRAKQKRRKLKKAQRTKIFLLTITVCVSVFLSVFPSLPFSLTLCLCVSVSVSVSLSLSLSLSLVFNFVLQHGYSHVDSWCKKIYWRHQQRVCFWPLLLGDECCCFYFRWCGIIDALQRQSLFFSVIQLFDWCLTSTMSSFS